MIKIKKVMVYVLIGIMTIQVIGCQKKDAAVQTQRNTEDKETIQEESKEEISQSSIEGSGAIVILPEGIEVPEGAIEMDAGDVSGLPEGAIFVPEGIEIPKGSQVLLQLGDDDGQAMPQIPTMGSSAIKDNLKASITSINKKVRKVLNQKSHKIHPDFNMKNTQILLISNMLKTAYLMNSQDEKYGSPDEIVEYATDTIQDKGLLTQLFSITQFNGKPTYVFNVDTFAFMSTNLEQDIIKVIVHEAIHLVLQKKIDKDMITVEENLEVSRSIRYPLDSEGRSIRGQVANYYKKALKTGNQKEREQLIKEGNYFLQKYIQMDERNSEDISFDRIEGQARYFEYRALAILEGMDNEADITKRARELYIESGDYAIELSDLSKSEEFYLIGSLAYALIYTQGEQAILGYNNPVTYLLKKYGVTQTEGDKKLALDIKSKYDKMNTSIKAKIDDITRKLEDDAYVKIKIPIYDKYTENQTVMFGTESVEYKYGNEHMTIDNVSREVRVGDGRILLKGATTMSNDMGEHYVFIPEEDVSIDGDRLTVQINNVQIYDAKFVENQGIHELTE